MIAAMDVVGNPSSVHGEGRAAKTLVERARAQVAQAFGAEGADVIFTSGATEAAALALAGGADGSRNFPSPVEHDAVAAWHRGDDGAAPSLSEDWRFGPDGALVASFGSGLMAECLSEGRRRIVSVTAANSETGILHDTQAFASDAGAGTSHRLFVDATQAFGKTPFAFNWSGADMAICSAHKLGGPKGIGALVVKRGTDLAAQIKGGGQEMGRRSGTENVVGIAGFGAAAEAAARDLAEGRWVLVEKLRNILESAIEVSAKGAIFVGKSASRLPNTSCFAVPGWKGETQVMQMDLAGFAVSAGSACSSGKVRGSRVLTAMGYGPDVASCAIRVSLGLDTTESDVGRFVETWLTKYEKHRARAA